MIQSLLDNDLYKFTMQRAVLENFPNAEVEYQFKDRGQSTLYNEAFLKGFQEELEKMSEMSFSNVELDFVSTKLPFLANPSYLAYLKDFRFNPDEVQFEIDSSGHFQMGINGNWGSTILWEVPLLALTSELYFKHCVQGWNLDGQYEIAASKAANLKNARCYFADFGTRRRRSSALQEIFIRNAKSAGGDYFTGTSNVHYARMFDLRAIGTMAHEWIMGVSGMDGLRHANRDALNRWSQTYQGNLGIALTDTYGTKAFFEDFDGVLARLYDGVRHDSGCPFNFGDSVINHYQSLGIKPMSRTIVFSDGLDVDLAIKIKDYFDGRINTSFGIGTHFTNGFGDALKIVIKLWSINGVPVVKLSDDRGKIQGDKDACRVAKWTFFNQPLDV